MLFLTVQSTNERSPSFVMALPSWGTLIALHDGRQPVLGLIDQPEIGERFTWAGELARFTGPHGSSGLQVSGTQKISEAVVFTTFPEVGSSQEQAAFHALVVRRLDEMEARASELQAALQEARDALGLWNWLSVGAAVVAPLAVWVTAVVVQQRRRPV